MSLYVLDTDHLTLYERDNEAITARAESLPPDQLAITIVTVEEQLTGWYASIRKARSLEKRARAYDGLFCTVALVKKLRVLPFPAAALARYDDLRKQFPRSGKMDLSIAAIVLETNGILVTRNRSDFAKVPGLRIEDWSRPAT
jgi:tRNA(fMet)-specific endonuclease VapC